MMLVKKRIVRSSPPSLVKCAFAAASVRHGVAASAPNSAQVPRLMYANSLPVVSGTAATALAVSCVVFVAGCSEGCYSLPDGEVEDAGGVEEVQRVMRVYGDGLGPDIEED